MVSTAKHTNIKVKYRLLKKMVWTASGVYEIEPKTYQKAAEICGELSRKGVNTTVGKFSKEGDSPDKIACEYEKISNLMKNNDAICDNFYLSIKPPALNFELSFIKKIAVAAEANGQNLHFDSHGYHIATPTCRLINEIKKEKIFEKSFENNKWYGITLPTRWKRSIEDAKWAIQNGLRVRLVKGEFSAGSSAFEDEPKRGFLNLVEMLSGYIPELAIATHDYELAKNAIEKAQKRQQKIELELLYGMPVGNMIRLSKEMNVPLRFYIPYGDTLLVYGALHFIKYPQKLLRSNPLYMFESHKRKIQSILDVL